MTLTVQFYTMLAMIGMGSMFGAALDTYNRFLNRTKRKRWLVFLNDILFWILQALFIFYILFIVNFGEVRFYIFLALLCGFAAYQSLLKGIYLQFLDWIIRTAISVYLFFVKVFKNMIFSPIKWLVLFIVSILFTLGKGVWGVLKLLYKVLFGTIHVLLKPIFWLIRIFWGLLPKKLTKEVEKLYNKFAGKSVHFIKKVYNKIKSWTNRK